MDGNILKYLAFVTVAECGSFTKTAKLLGYVQSSISKMIADLEAEWNVVLMERSRAGIQVTSEGMAMLPYARALLVSYRKAQEQAAALSGIAAGTIRIGTFSSVAAQWAPNIIRRFQEDYPGIRYELLLGDYPEIEQWIIEILEYLIPFLRSAATPIPLRSQCGCRGKRAAAYTHKSGAPQSTVSFLIFNRKGIE